MPAYQYEPGSRPIDGYTIQYALGRGGFGEVYFATSDAGREVALKAVQNYEDIELRGIRHCMNLKSRHLVMIFDVRHAADGTPWVIMEYIAGPSLRAILDESPSGIGAEKAAYFLRELAHGLTDLHDAGIVHRDLKPHNVFFEAGSVKIGDYSLSKAMSVSHRSGHTMTVGSVHYMAPEISLGRYDKTVDIYALGVILYEMLSGRPPYVGESVGEVLMKHLQGEPDVSEIAEPFAGVICKAMQRDPKDRFQSSVEMAGAVLNAGDVSSLVDSFNPATLSMIGERSRTRMRADASDRNSLADTFTSPTSLRTTRAGQGEQDTSPVPIWLLIPLSLISVGCLVTLGMLLNGPDVWFAGNGFVMSLFLVTTGVISSYFYRWAMPQGSGIWPGLGRRLITLVPTFFSVAVYASLLAIGDLERFAMASLGCGFAQVLVDWQQFVSPNRLRRVNWLPTLVCGVIATVVSGVVDVTGDFFCGVFAAVITVSVAVTVQLISPFAGTKNSSTKQSASEIPARVSGKVADDSLRSPALVNVPELQGTVS